MGITAGSITANWSPFRESYGETGREYFCALGRESGCWLLITAGASAQSPPTERTFHASKADVQKTLQGDPILSRRKASRS